MNFNLVYRQQLLDNYLDAGETIAKASPCKISQLVNQSFFGGGVLTPKSFKNLASIYIPEEPGMMTTSVNTGISTCKINKKVSYCAIIGYVECLPGIGSPVAVLSIIYNLFGMLSSYFNLKKSVKELDAVDRTPYNVGRGASSHATDKVFKAAVNYTVHQNAVVGSLLAVIPFVKPATRLAQGIIFNLT